MMSAVPDWKREMVLRSSKKRREFQLDESWGGTSSYST